MQPSQQKPEVVYRRADLGPAPGPREQVGGYAPALAPLVIGFLLLLAVILTLGLISANKMTEVGANSQRLNLEYSTRLNRLLDLRLGLMALDNEARKRDLSQSRRELKPPFDIRLDHAREQAQL